MSCTSLSTRLHSLRMYFLISHSKNHMWSTFIFLHRYRSLLPSSVLGHSTFHPSSVPYLHKFFLFPKTYELRTHDHSTSIISLQFIYLSPSPLSLSDWLGHHCLIWISDSLSQLTSQLSVLPPSNVSHIKTLFVFPLHPSPHSSKWPFLSFDRENKSLKWEFFHQTYKYTLHWYPHPSLPLCAMTTAEANLVLSKANLMCLFTRSHPFHLLREFILSIIPSAAPFSLSVMHDQVFINLKIPSLCLLASSSDCPISSSP